MTFTHGYALTIGVSTYWQSPWLDVPIASADAVAVTDILNNPQFCGYPINQTSTLHDKQATRVNILAALDELAQRTRPEDTVFLFHCGHGDYGTDGNYYLICHDSQVAGNKVERGTGISQLELLQKIKAIPAKRLLFVFNSCHSGELSPSLGGEQATGGKNFPDTVAEALLSTGRGRVILTACREEQKSWIGRGKHSLFTQALVDCLQGKGISPQGGYINLFDLYTALFETVHQTVKRLLDKEQEPELTILKGVGPLAVALYKGSIDTNLSVAEAVSAPSPGTAVREVDPERSRQLYQQLIHQAGGINFGQGNQVKIQGDMTGGDRMDARDSQGFIQHANEHAEQKFNNRIDTGGGAYIKGDVSVKGGDFVGRDKVIHSPFENMTRADFIALLEQLQSELKNAHLEQRISSIIENDLITIKVEAQTDKPTLPIIEAKLSSILNIMQKTAGIATSSIGLAKLIQRAIELAQTVFH